MEDTPWTPQAPDTRALRLVVVIDDADIGNPDDGYQVGEVPPESDRMPAFELTYGDGRTEVFRDPYAK